jgi:hypothetical protein
MKALNIIKIFIIFVAFMSLSSCEDTKPKSIRALLAQCQLESYSQTGKNFIKENYNEKYPDESYFNWMQLCMQTKDYDYNRSTCPKTNTNSLDVFNVKCYDKAR